VTETVRSRSPRGLEVWQALERKAAELREQRIGDLLAKDLERVARLGRDLGEIHFDFSKHLVDDEALALLARLAREQGLESAIEAMFQGAHINTTEDRAVLHVALRSSADSLVVDGMDVATAVREVRGRMEELAKSVREGSWLGATGKRIERVVNIGIGGSDLGPEMVTRALADFVTTNITFDFVSNIDPTAIGAVLAHADPATTLFIVVSKTFTTLETLTNASAAKDWLVAALGEQAVARHFVAVSADTARAVRFGIDPSHVFAMWDFVGGRYSVDSAVGLSVMIAIGPERFRSFLSGFRKVDEHFRTTPIEANIPVLMGLLSVWYRNFLGAETQAVLPYSERLARFPAYLQQLTMESNGKSVRIDGQPVDYGTGAIWWGERGTNGQHAFYQLLHQGTILVPVDLIVIAEPSLGPEAQQDLLVANAFAQARALAFGRNEAELARQGVPEALRAAKRMPGNRPSTVILVPRLTPESLGSLIALYEHSVFVQGVIWGIDSFDQWGVELGKELAGLLAPAVSGPARPTLSDLDASTIDLVYRYRHLRGRPV
jgi:glucose-6-phosphate isomerase